MVFRLRFKKVGKCRQAHKIMANKKAVSLFSLFTLLFSMTVNSLNFTASLFYEGQYTDNFDKTPLKAPKEFISNVGAGLGFTAESVRYQYQGGYDFSYVDYL